MSYLYNLFKGFFIKSFKLINYIRLFSLNLLFIVVVVFILFSMGDNEKTVNIAKNSYLNLNLNGFIVEQKQPVNLSQQLSNQLSGSDTEPVQEFEVQEIINTIQHAQKDPKITGLVLQLDGLRSGSLNQLSDIGEAIEAFKTSNKPVFAYSDNFSQTQYYLAAYADHITLAPNGAVFLQGYAVNRLYFKELLNHLLITPHIFKVGIYKSFVEPYTETEMSNYSKEANAHWLNQLWQHYITHVLTQRSDRDNLTASSVNPSLTELKSAFRSVSGDTAKYALTVGLVDELSFYDQFMEQLTDTQANDNKLNIIDYQYYTSTVPPKYQFTGEDAQIAVVHGTGEIISGYSEGSEIADQSFNELLKQALNNARVKAVVLRLDTPGGSAFASENIRQQVLALKAAGKKVVVSMGSVTASGGYWIAASADKVVASRTTLTGSIGIFGMFATIDKSLNKIGIYNDGIATNALSNIGITQPLNPELAEIFQIGIDSGYANFLKVVSEGRNLSLKAVDKIAQGRVWTGVDGLNNGLVDELGNLQSAIELAADLAKLDKYDTISIKPKTSSKQAFINEFFAQSISLLPKGIISASPLTSLLTEVDKQANLALRLNDPQNRFVYCTFCQIK
ncbi:signal peptide peptidase SppA [Psychromonas algicola]|uniref:signal peptide peptidase SppA n=1 Tax=Psychromonas algicola TaxID=2555642 RepID=UPI0010675CE1|nr:signal peptide peptidase SppA [Psychromonas sp. RZ5]TEW52943.1 signal peptide peptidase SppA [Psychromonas sp. RZ5]